VEEISLPLFFLTLRRGLCGEGEGAGIVSEMLEGQRVVIGMVWWFFEVASL
jgi:hypothetical protein